jgi:hypothetical protein
MGQALGLLEGIVGWVRAAGAPDSHRAAGALEGAVARGAYSGRLETAQIARGTALAVVEPRLPEWKWRKRRPALSALHGSIAARDRFRATQPPGL